MSGVFNIGCVTMHPRDCGKAYDDVSDEVLRALPYALTPEERAAPHAKYYTEDLPRPTEEMVAAYEGPPMDPADAFLPQEAGARFLIPGHMKREMGYCVLPNGVGYAAMLIQQPGRTDEKMRKYNEDFAPEGNLGYKIWFPGAHLMHFTDGCFEDFGWGPQKIRFGHPIDFKFLGIDEGTILERDPATLSLMCTSSTAYNPFRTEDGIEYSCMMSHLRSVPGGRELRIRYWFGMAIDPEGQVLTNLKPGESTPLEHMRLMAKHCAWEYTNEKRRVDALWADVGN